MTSEDVVTGRGPGRPRSEAARRAILAAALELLEARGYGRLTMEAIAREAGVSKQTVYRWWPTKAAIVLEGLNEQASTLVPGEDHGSLEADLRVFVRRSVGGLRGRNVAVLSGLMAESQLDEAFAASFRDGFLARRRAALRDVLERARDRGEIASAARLDLLVEIFFGTLWYRILNRHAPLNRRFADELTDALLVLCAGARQR